MTAPTARPRCLRCRQGLRAPPPALLAEAHAALAAVAGLAGAWTRAEATRWKLANEGLTRAGKGRHCAFCAHLAASFAREVVEGLRGPAEAPLPGESESDSD